MDTTIKPRVSQLAYNIAKAIMHDRGYTDGRWYEDYLTHSATIAQIELDKAEPEAGLPGQDGPDVEK